jgi:hypothetical protein
MAGEHATMFSGLSGKPLPCPKPVDTRPTISDAFVKENKAPPPDEVPLNEALMNEPTDSPETAILDRIPEMRKVCGPAAGTKLNVMEVPADDVVGGVTNTTSEVNTAVGKLVVLFGVLDVVTSGASSEIVREAGVEETPVHVNEIVPRNSTVPSQRTCTGELVEEQTAWAEAFRAPARKKSTAKPNEKTRRFIHTLFPRSRFWQESQRGTT